MITISLIHQQKNTLLKIFKGADFQSHIFSNLLGKSFQIVALFSLIISLDNAVVVAEKNSKTLFLHYPEANHPPKHKCIRAIAIMTFILSKTFKHCNTVYCQISSWHGH